MSRSSKFSRYAISILALLVAAPPMCAYAQVTGSTTSTATFPENVTLAPQAPVTTGANATAVSPQSAEIQAIAQQVYQQMHAQTGGDPEKMQALLQQYMSNPAQFYATMTPEQQARVRSLVPTTGGNLGTATGFTNTTAGGSTTGSAGAIDTTRPAGTASPVSPATGVGRAQPAGPVSPGR